MRRSLVVVVALLAASCSGPTKPDHWSVERRASTDFDNSPMASVCEDIEALALGSLATETDIEPALDELARLGAVAGASDALVHLTTAHDADDPSSSLAAAAVDLDAAGYAECEIPIFSALYVTTTWASCHGAVDIPAAIVIGDAAAGTCNADDSPGFLPCWDVEAGYLPVDCRTGETVRADGGNWVEA